MVKAIDREKRDLRNGYQREAKGIFRSSRSTLSLSGLRAGPEILGP